MQLELLSPDQAPMGRAMAELIEEGLRVGRRIDCFDYVPSNAAVLASHLQSLPPGTFCEWGSGMGIGVGIAEMLGFKATGIESSEPMVDASRRLLRKHCLDAEIFHGDYLDRRTDSDVYFVYCWPGQGNEVKRRFPAMAPVGARLLFCDGAERIKCFVNQ